MLVKMAIRLELDFNCPLPAPSGRTFLNPIQACRSLRSLTPGYLSHAFGVLVSVAGRYADANGSPLATFSHAFGVWSVAR